MQFNFLLINSFVFALFSFELMFMLMQFSFCSLEHIIVYILLSRALFCFVCVNPMQKEKGLRVRTSPMLNGVQEQLGFMPLKC